MTHQFVINTNRKESILFTVNLGQFGISQIDFRMAVPRLSKLKSYSEQKPPLVKQLQHSMASYFKGGRVSFSSIPLDMSQASNFDRKVWNKTRKIPQGKLVTYEKLAELSGSRKAYRAVGNAMNKNPFPILIPCHRVIRKDGGLGGYSKGLRLKKMLLSLEKSLVDKSS